MGNGVRQGLNYSEFSRLMVFEPSYDEQVAIADHLDAKCAEIDDTIAQKQEQLSTLEAYKKSLIYEYVTGKRRCPAVNNVLSEKDYQKFLLERLADNGYVIRKASHFDRLFAMDREMLMKFLADTQPDTMDYLRKIYKDDLEDTIVSFINAETTKARGSLIDVLKHGIEISTANWI